MDIIIDSNILTGDISLNSVEWDAVLDYLNKTGSAIYLPQVVTEEIQENYIKIVGTTLRELKNVMAKIQKLDVECGLSTAVVRIDFDKVSGDYLTRLKARLNIKEHQILPYVTTELAELSRRLMKRIKPTKSNGTGFRDTIIWLSVLEKAKHTEEKAVHFISGNTTDFANKGKDQLADPLKIEADQQGVKVNYFSSLRKFIENHSTHIESITLDFILDLVDIEVFKKHLLEKLTDNKEYKALIETSYEEVGEKVCTGHINPVNCSELDFQQNISIYEKAGGTLLVFMNAQAEVEAEIESYSQDYLKYLQHYEIGDPEMCTQYHYDSAIYPIYCMPFFTLTFKANEVIDLQITDCDFYDGFV